MHKLGHVLAIVMAAAGAVVGHAAPTEADPLGPHMTVLGVTLELTTLLDAQVLIGPADLRHNGGDAAASASSECYVGRDGTMLALTSTSEMGGGTTVTNFQLVEREALADFSEGVGYVVPSAGRPRCVPLKALSRSTPTAGGLRLGMKMDDVQRLLGKPREAGSNHAVFISEAKVPLTPEQTKALAASNPSSVREGFLIRQRTVRVEFAGGRVVAIRAYQVSTT